MQVFPLSFTTLVQRHVRKTFNEAEGEKKKTWQSTKEQKERELGCMRPKLESKKYKKGLHTSFLSKFSKGFLGFVCRLGRVKLPLD